MNLNLLCRINGVWVMLNGISAVVMPDMWFNMAGLEGNAAAYAAAGGLGVAAFSLGLISWRTVDIAGDAIKSYGMLFGIAHGLFLLLALYQLTSGIFGGSPAYMNIVVSLVLCLAFVYYSRKSE